MEYCAASPAVVRAQREDSPEPAPGATYYQPVRAMHLIRAQALEASAATRANPPPVEALLPAPAAVELRREQPAEVQRRERPASKWRALGRFGAGTLETDLNEDAP